MVADGLRVVFVVMSFTSGFALVAGGFEWLCRWLRVVTLGYVRFWDGYKWLGLVTIG